MPGRTIGEYQITELIGETDNADIYRGFQPGQNRYVAVKILKPDDATDPAAVQKFLQQASLTAQLQHPNILPVFDSGQMEGVVYQVSQLAEMGALNQHLGEFYFPQQALALFSGLTEGLEYIHIQGYVHGNLKSSNVFLDEIHRPLLADFGRTHPAGAASPYTAPEQAQGGVVDRRTDVYAMGILLYEVLTGQQPSYGIVASPRAKRPDLPQEVDQVVLKATAQNPDQRFQSVREFQNALTAAVQQPVPTPAPIRYPTPTTTPAPTPVYQAAPAPQSKRTNWVAMILGIILVGLICGGLVYFIPQISGEQDTAAESPPVEVEIVEVPEVEPRPTREPLPTREPVETIIEQPEQPAEQPPAEEPPAEDASPDEGTGDEEGGISNPCPSAGFIAGAAFLGSVVTSYRKRKQK